MVPWVIHSCVTLIYDILVNVFFYYLCFVSVVPIAISCVAHFFLLNVNFIISYILRCWSQKLFRRMLSYNYVFRGTIAAITSIVDLSIIRLLILYNLSVTDFVLFECSTKSTLGWHTIIVLCCIRLDIKVVILTLEKLLLRQVHFIWDKFTCS